MHNNYFFLRQLSKQLENRLAGFSVASCFSQNKDELLIEFNDSKTSFFLRADLSASFSCLAFPDQLSRARKNSIDLFPEIVLKKVEGIRQYENERSFSITLGGNLHLLFKMHGSRANVVLFQDDAVIGVFRNHLKADLALLRSGLDRSIDWSREFFLTHQETLPTAYFTLGKPVWQWLHKLGFESADGEHRWMIFTKVLKTLEHPEYFIAASGSKIIFLLMPEGDVIQKFTDPIAAITEFYFKAVASNAWQGESTAAFRAVQTRIESAEAYLAKTNRQLDLIEHDKHYKIWADMIMANLYKLSPGLDKIELEDFYHGNDLIEVPLKNTLNGQKNAEVYYRKSKNQQIEIQKLREAISQKTKELEKHRRTLTVLQEQTDLRGLRKQMEEGGVQQRKEEKQPELVPYREFEFKGWRIWVGRNAESNDKLTLKYSYKEDLWLHAKDVAGSHVLLKHQSGKNYPKDVIEYAASLAAFYSKRKNENLCPVAYTTKKYVRKRKGDPAGSVVVEREDVILVQPAIL